MAYGQDFRAEALRTLAAGSITSSYTAIGGPFTNAERILFIDNLTDADLYFSFDGVVDHLVIPTNGFKTFDICANEVANYNGFFTTLNTTIYVRSFGVSPTTKAVYVQAMFARGGR